MAMPHTEKDLNAARRKLQKAKAAEIAARKNRQQAEDEERTMAYRHRKFLRGELDEMGMPILEKVKA